MTAGQVSALSHEEAAWKHTADGDSIPHELAFVPKEQVITPTARRLAPAAVARYGLADASWHPCTTSASAEPLPSKRTNVTARNEAARGRPSEYDFVAGPLGARCASSHSSMNFPNLQGQPRVH